MTGGSCAVAFEEQSCWPAVWTGIQFAGAKRLAVGRMGSEKGE